MTLDKESDGVTAQETAETSLNRSRNVRRKLADADDKSKEELAYAFLVVAAKELTTNKDTNALFGQLVAAQLRKLTPRNQAIARNRIQNILFKLEMEQMDAGSK
ncbi:hypothetical protein LSTR_LSTR000871 [Laodelphax striatellus]|uniref:BESS domain-containing protein n=1 Tax=Laodelphax striatellus TaxID=195883 RepID=A0A482X1V0_LAOST|nr:hypothetical protein LSTR_LSTR000871 [Laodelphax striatellus]